MGPKRKSPQKQSRLRLRTQEDFDEAAKLIRVPESDSTVDPNFRSIFQNDTKDVDAVLEAAHEMIQASARDIDDAFAQLKNEQVSNKDADRRLRLRQDTQPFQRGIIRHLVLILDLSEAMLDKDMRPNRYIVTLRHAQEYVREFFEQNPISQIRVLAMHDGVCIRVSELSGNPNDHITAIQELRNPRQGLPTEPKGSASLQNALEMARGSLYHTPQHGTREVVIIFGALQTIDPGDINKTIRECVKDKLRVSIIGMSASMRICAEICSRTNAGDESCYTVATDAGTLRDLLMATTTPPVIRRGTQGDKDVNKASLLQMGFPSRVDEETPTLCACHSTPISGGYECSRCKAKVCSLPMTCPSCGLTLILSTHLARSYHHLFPLRNWITVSWQRAKEVGSVKCKGCLNPFPPVPEESKGKEKISEEDHTQTDTARAVGDQMASESSRYECESCGHHFCIDCDLFCHEVVHNCPGCLSSAPAPPTSNGEIDVDGHNGGIEQ